jgi:hypothetical protein
LEVWLLIIAFVLISYLFLAVFSKSFNPIANSWTLPQNDGPCCKLTMNPIANSWTLPQNDEPCCKLTMNPIANSWTLSLILLRVPPTEFRNSLRISIKIFFQFLVFSFWLFYLFYESQLIFCLISKIEFDRQVTVAKVIHLLGPGGYRLVTSAAKENSEWLLGLKNSHFEEFRNLHQKIMENEKNKKTFFFQNFDEAFEFFLRNPTKPLLLDASSDKALYYSAEYADISYCKN